MTPASPRRMHSLLPEPDPSDRPIFDAARDYLGEKLGSNVTRESLREINHRHGTDFATAVLYHHFYNRLPQQPSAAPAMNRRPWMIAIVPGAFYKEHPEIGGDGREIHAFAKRNRWHCETIPTASLGTTSQNSETIQAFLADRSANYQVLVVSLSKGTTDLMAALTRNPTIMDKASGWISISGVVRGTMMADWLLDRWRLRPILHLMCWKHGADQQAVRDLRHRASASYKDFPRIFSIHIAGFPLQRHLSNWRSRLWHRRFRKIGPNDSVVLLEDLLEIPGIVVPVWGADHYLKSDWNLPAALEKIVTDHIGPSSQFDPRLRHPPHEEIA